MTMMTIKRKERIHKDHTPLYVLLLSVGNYRHTVMQIGKHVTFNRLQVDDQRTRMSVLSLTLSR
jgi:hypothetical protein